MSRSVVHLPLSLLLSLLLLVSQQMALAHGALHWHAALQQSAPQQSAHSEQSEWQAAGGHSDAPALDQFCAECAADAQLDVLLPLPDYGFHLPHLAATASAARCTEGVRPQALRPFQPRAPPRAI